MNVLVNTYKKMGELIAPFLCQDLTPQ